MKIYAVNNKKKLNNCKTICDNITMYITIIVAPSFSF